MSSLLTLAQDLEQKSKVQRERTREMLKAAFSEHEVSVKLELSESERKISAAISAHEQELISVIDRTTKGMLKTVGWTWLTITMISVLLIATSGGILWWQSNQIVDHALLISEMKRTEAMLSKKNSGVQLTVCGDLNRPCVKVNPKAGAFGEDSDWMVLAGK